MLTATHCMAENDVNGNPRRLYIIQEVLEGQDYSRLVAVIDEDYNGPNAFRKQYPEAIRMLDITISAKEYKNLLKLI